VESKAGVARSSDKRGDSMTETPEAERTSNKPKEAPARKPWRAPGFVVMDVMATDVVCQGGDDGGPMNSQS
jgi:hypothetical protein